MTYSAESQTAKMFYIVTFLYMGLIFYMSSQGSIDQPGPLHGISNIDKFEHFSEFFVLGALMVLSFRFSRRRWIREFDWVLALACSIIYACTDEIHQMFVPGRTTDLIDLLVDSTGVTIASFIGAYISNPDRKNQDRPFIGLKASVVDNEE